MPIIGHAWCNICVKWRLNLLIDDVCLWCISQIRRVLGLKHVRYAETYRLNDLLKLPDRYQRRSQNIAKSRGAYFRIEVQNGACYAIVIKLLHTPKVVAQLSQPGVMLAWHAFDKHSMLGHEHVGNAAFTEAYHADIWQLSCACTAK